MKPFWSAVALIVAVAVLAAYIAGSAPPAGSQDAVPEQDLLTAACAQAYALAEASQVGMTRCRLVGVSQQNPNYAIVTVQAKIIDQGLFQVKVYLARSAWNSQTYTITPEVKG